MMRVPLVTSNLCLAYADESSTACRYFGVGATVYFPTDKPMEARAYDRLRRRKAEAGLGLRGDVKWNKVPTKPGPYLDCYMDFVSTFLESKRLRFSCLVVDTLRYRLDDRMFFRGSKDAGMDSFLFYLLSRRVLFPFAQNAKEIVFRVDRRRRPQNVRLMATKARPRRYCVGDLGCSPKLYVRSIAGSRHPIIQVNDLLLGATMAKWNKGTRSKTKLAIIEKMESEIGHRLDVSSPPHESKFNVWEFTPRKETE